MSAAPALALTDVSIRYGTIEAVRRLSLRVRYGEICALLGPNGSGKSSTLAAIAGLLDTVGGEIRVAGLSRTESPLDYARRIGLVPQELALYEELTVLQNLNFFASLYDLGSRERAERCEWVLERVGLTARACDRVGTLSGGMQRRINLACALLHQPTLLLLDEPTVALDPASRESLFALLHDLREEGCTILLTTHYLDEAEQFCDRTAVLRDGELLGIGRPSDLVRRTTPQAILYGHLRDPLGPAREEAIRSRLSVDVDLEITGRRLRLSAVDNESLGSALAIVLAEGADLEAFRTPPIRLERLLEPVSNAVRRTACDAG